MRVNSVGSMNTETTTLTSIDSITLETPDPEAAAPKGLASTGDPSFCTLWTLCGMPAISLPLLQSVNGLPIGVQLVGPRYGDARRLRTARWLAAKAAAG